MTSPSLPEAAETPSGFHQIASSPWEVFWVVALAMALFSFGLRFMASLNDSLWLDELHTSWVVRGDLVDVWQRASIGNQSPLFFWLTWLSCQWLGLNEVGLRAVSNIASCGLVVLSGAIVFNRSRWWPSAALTMMMVGVSDLFLYYGSEARPYALLQLLGVVQLLCFWWFLSELIGSNARTAGRPLSPWRSLCAFSISSTLLCYTHLTGALVAVPELLFGFGWYGWLYFNQTTRRSIARSFAAIFGWAGIAVSVTALACWPLLGSLQSVADRSPLWGDVTSLSQLFQELKLKIVVWYLVPLGVALVCWAASVRPLRIDRYRERGLPAVLVCGWGGLILVAIVAIHYFKLAPLALSRYLSVGLAAGPIFVGMAIHSNRQGLRYLLLAISLAAVIGGGMVEQQWWWQSSRNNRLLPLRNEPWYRAISQIETDKDRREYPIFLFAAVLEDALAFEDVSPEFLEYLQFPVRGLYSLGPERTVYVGPTIYQPHFLNEHVQDAVSKNGCWVLIRHESPVVIEILDELVFHSQKLPNSIEYLNVEGELLWLVRIDF